MSPEEREELASLYAIGLLEGEELKAFEMAMAKDRSLMALVAEYEEGSTLLAKSLPLQSAPDSIRQNVLGEIQASQPAPEPPAREGIAFAWAPWALAALLAVLCAVALMQKSQVSAVKSRMEADYKSLQARVINLNAERDRLKERVTALEEEKTNLQVRLASLETHEPLKEIRNINLVPQPQAPVQSELTALWDQTRQTGVLDLAKLPPPPAGADYQLWIIPANAKQPLDAGILTTAVGARAVFQSPQPVAQIGALAISLERKGGSTQPQGPVIYLGKL